MSRPYNNPVSSLAKHQTCTFGSVKSNLVMGRLIKTILRSTATRDHPHNPISCHRPRHPYTLGSRIVLCKSDPNCSPFPCRLWNPLAHLYLLPRLPRWSASQSHVYLVLVDNDPR